MPGLLLGAGGEVGASWGGGSGRNAHRRHDACLLRARCVRENWATFGRNALRVPWERLAAGQAGSQDCLISPW